MGNLQLGASGRIKLDKNYLIPHVIRYILTNLILFDLAGKHAEGRKQDISDI